MVHPTDFDDELASQIDQCFIDRDGSATLHSRYNVEKIEWIVINGKEARDSAAQDTVNTVCETCHEALRDFSPRAPKGPVILLFV